jgi:hypothetical protein
MRRLSSAYELTRILAVLLKCVYRYQSNEQAEHPNGRLKLRISDDRN